MNGMLSDADANGWKADSAKTGTRVVNSAYSSTETYMLSDRLQHVPSLCDSGSQHLRRRSFLRCSSAHLQYCGLLHVWIVSFSGGVFYLPSVQLYRVSRHARFLPHIWPDVLQF